VLPFDRLLRVVLGTEIDQPERMRIGNRVHRMSQERVAARSDPMQVIEQEDIRCLAASRLGKVTHECIELLFARLRTQLQRGFGRIRDAEKIEKERQHRLQLVIEECEFTGNLAPGFVIAVIGTEFEDVSKELEEGEVWDVLPVRWAVGGVHSDAACATAIDELGA
jgi:hypothetical protein